MVPQIGTGVDLRDRLGHWAMRWGLGRNRYRVAPGLYAAGSPDHASPVLVTANYKMTFDRLRRELAGIDAWLLVLDTRGINVWCAAGKGTFGTDEVVGRVRAARLDQLVSHRDLIVPQLGAPGVAAHEVRRETGFRVIYGPIRAADLSAFLAAGMQASPAMRRVTFSVGERLVLTPVELTGVLRQSFIWLLPVLFLLGGIGPWGFSFRTGAERGGAALLACLAGVLTGAVLTPIFLPCLPGRAFSVKGAAAALLLGLLAMPLLSGSLGAADTAAVLLAGGAVASWCAMHFTGATPFTSPSGVEKEMRRAIPLQAAAAFAAAALWIGGAFIG